MYILKIIYRKREQIELTLDKAGIYEHVFYSTVHCTGMPYILSSSNNIHRKIFFVNMVSVKSYIIMNHFMQ